MKLKIFTYLYLLTFLFLNTTIQSEGFGTDNPLYRLTSYNAMVSNFEPGTTGVATFISLLFPPAAPFVITAEAIVGTVIAGTGLYAAYKHHKKHQTFAQMSAELKNNSNSSPKKPDDGDENEHPHGIYEEAGYHHINSKNKKSPSPKNGQHCLDYSLPYLNNQRIAIEGDNFIILKQTSPGKFHGHTIQWKKIPEKIQKILEQKGYVKASGKIIKQITEKTLL